MDNKVRFRPLALEYIRVKKFSLWLLGGVFFCGVFIFLRVVLCLNVSCTWNLLQRAHWGFYQEKPHHDQGCSWGGKRSQKNHLVRMCVGTLVRDKQISRLVFKKCSTAAVLCTPSHPCMGLDDREVRRLSMRQRFDLQCTKVIAWRCLQRSQKSLIVHFWRTFRVMTQVFEVSHECSKTCL